MVRSYTAKYTKIDAGYLGQLIDWPEVVTEGHDIEECRSMLRDALQEMILAYKDQGKEIPSGNDPCQAAQAVRPDHGQRDLQQSGLTPKF